eukprot:scaffold52388_cov22-Cyclotella_meneghiniana.AAC.1
MPLPKGERRNTPKSLQKLAFECDWSVEEAMRQMSAGDTMYNGSGNNFVWTTQQLDNPPQAQLSGAKEVDHCHAHGLKCLS